MNIKKLILIVSLITPVAGFAQESSLGNWFICFGNKNFGSDLNLHYEVQYRNYNVIGDLEQLLLRTGLGYNLTESNNNILLGYAFIHSRNYTSGTDDKIGVDEHRIFQQFITRQSFGRVSVQHRYRFEQRFIQDDFRLRFRYFLALNVPLNNKDLLDKTVYFSAYNEIFLNVEDNPFDRNRLYGGLGYKLSKQVRLEAGYMNQFLNGRNSDQINLIAFMNF